MTRLEALRGLRISTWEGIWATVWLVLTGGAFQTGFALYLGATPFVQGILAGLPAAVGLLQLPASLIVQKRTDRKRFVASFALAGRLCFIPIALLPFVAPEPVRLPLFVVLQALSAALLTITVPAWTGWMSDLVPADSRGRYFARRNMLAGLVTMLVPLPAGALLDRLRPDLGFPLLFGIGCAAALVAVSFLLRQPETPATPAISENPLKALAAPLADRAFRKFLIFAAAMVVGQGIAGQFFGVYMLRKDELNFSYLVVQVLGAVAAGSGLGTTPVWGYLTDKYGARPVLMIASWGVIVPPLLWSLTAPGAGWTNIATIVVINLLSGAFWGAVGLTQFNLLLTLTPPERRATYVAVFSSVTGLAGGFAPVAGGAILSLLETPAVAPLIAGLGAFKVLFLIAAAARGVALLLLKPVVVIDSHSTRDVLERITQTGAMRSYRSLRQLSRPTDATTRSETVAKLGEMRAALAVEELIAALDDISLGVRLAAARSLGEIGDLRAIEPLSHKLNDPAAGIGEAACSALAEIGSLDATGALMAAAQGPDATVRIAAFHALERLADPKSGPVLVAALNPAHPTRCEAACNAVAAIGPRLGDDDARAAFPRLIYLLSQEVDRGMRLAAARALESLAPLATLSGDGALLSSLSTRLQTERDPAALARQAAALAKIARALDAPAEHWMPQMLQTLDRLDGAGLAYLQALAALSDTLLEPGTLYARLAESPTGRDETVSHLLRDFGKRQQALTDDAPRLALSAVDSFSRGDYVDALVKLSNLASPEQFALHALANRARHRGDATAEEALLGVLLLDA